MKTSEVKISYNPYTVKTEIFVNGVLHSGLMDKVKYRRLSQWIDSLFPLILEELNSRTFSLVFEGTKLDEEDVRDAIGLFLQDMPEASIHAQYFTTNKSVDERVSDIVKLFEEAKDSPIEEFRSPEMQHAFQRALAPEFEVNVLATMSAGKSTLINAMLGLELMPSKNEACTATIAKIHDHDQMNCFEAQRYNHDGHLLDDWTVVYDPASDEVVKRTTLLEEWNEDKETSLIEMRGNIPAINECEQVRLVLVDTPGPNNSLNESHREATIQAITSNRPSMILYVLNTQNLGVQDDKSLLNIIKDTMEKGGREAQDRFVFVANKIDAFEPEEGELVSSALRNVRNYLKENGIHNPLVIPASAELAMMLRTEKKRGGEALASSQRADLASHRELFLEEEEMDLLEHVKHDIGRQAYVSLKEKSEHVDEDGKAEIRSGVPILEQLLENYISKHALPARIKDIVDNFNEIARNVEIIKKKKTFIEKGEQELHALNEAILNFQNDKKRIEDAKKFRERVKELKIKPNQKMKNFKGNMELNNLLAELDATIKDSSEKQETLDFIETKKNEAENKLSEINVAYREDIQTDLKERLSELRQEYQHHVAGILEKAFPSDISEEITEFQGSLLEMKPVDQLLSDYQYDEMIVVGEKRESQKIWYDPRTWFKDDKIIPILSNVKKIDVPLLGQELTAQILAKSEKIKEHYKVQLQKNLENTKNILLKEMDQIDHKTETVIGDLLNAERNKEEKRRQLKEDSEILDWHNKFCKDLNDILNLEGVRHAS